MSAEVNNTEVAADIAAREALYVNIPEEIRQTACWIAFEQRPDASGKSTKYPRTLYGGASTTNNGHLLNFDHAVVLGRKWAGIGFVFNADHRYGAVDLDACVDEHGAIADWAQKVIDQLDSYTEFSPSHRGIRILVTLSNKSSRTKIERAIEGRSPMVYTLKSGEQVEKQVKLELFAGSNYCTVTGDIVPGCPGSIENRQSQFDALWDWCEAKRPPATPRKSASHSGGKSDLDDDEILTRCASARNSNKFHSLFDEGSTSGHGHDDSSADLALACIFAFWSRDPAQVERLMRRSKLARDKWDRKERQPGYLARTIDKALSTVTTWYEPRRRQENEGQDNGPADAGGDAESGEGENAHGDEGVAISVEDKPVESPGITPSPPFPTDSLPGPLAEIVKDGAAEIDADELYVVMPLLPALAAAIGNSTVIRLRRGYEQPAVIWAANIATSGFGKSPGIKLVHGPIYHLQGEAIDAYRDHMVEYQATIRAYEATPKKDRVDLPEPVKPSAKHYYVQDATAEGMAVLLDDNKRGLMGSYDELVGLFKGLNSYKKGGSDKETWLGFFDAGMVKVDRKGTIDRPTLVPRAFVSLYGGIQPKRMLEVFGDEDFDSGFIARFLLAVPAIEAKSWKGEIEASETRNRLTDLYSKLHLLPLDHTSATVKPRRCPSRRLPVRCGVSGTTRSSSSTTSR